MLTPRLTVRSLGLLSLLRNGPRSTSDLRDACLSVDVRLGPGTVPAVLQLLEQRDFVRSRDRQRPDGIGRVVWQREWTITDAGRSVYDADSQALTAVCALECGHTI